MPNGVPQLTFHGARIQRDAAALDAMAAEFRQRGCVKVPDLLAPSLLQWMQEQLSSSTFTAASHSGMESTELRLENCTALGLISFLVNDPIMLRFVEAISGRDRLTRFIGRIYRRLPGIHGDAWHDDVRPDRLVGMSLNLSAGVYDGGVFEIRETETQRPLGSIANTGFGDAIFFPIDDALQHRVSPLAGTVAKTAYAGWFGAMHDYNAGLRLSTAPSAR